MEVEPITDCTIRRFDGLTGSAEEEPEGRPGGQGRGKGARRWKSTGVDLRGLQGALKKPVKGHQPFKGPWSAP